MQNHFTYDQLTPLEQCISDFMANQQLRKNSQTKTKKQKEPVLNS